MLPYPGGSGFSKMIPFRVVKSYAHHVLLESMRYPSVIGLSNSFKMSVFPKDLAAALVMNEKQFIAWAEERREYVNTVSTAGQGNPRSIRTLREWNKIKDELRKGR